MTRSKVIYPANNKKCDVNRFVHRRPEITCHFADVFVKDHGGRFRKKKSLTYYAKKRTCSAYLSDSSCVQDTLQPVKCVKIRTRFYRSTLNRYIKIGNNFISFLLSSACILFVVIVYVLVCLRMTGRSIAKPNSSSL